MRCSVDTDVSEAKQDMFASVNAIFKSSSHHKPKGGDTMCNVSCNSSCNGSARQFHKTPHGVTLLALMAKTYEESRTNFCIL